jgi:TonB family protein
MRTFWTLTLLALLFTTRSPMSAEQVYTARDGVTMPKAVKLVKAQYTEKAAAARLQGTVTMEAVVLADGTVGEIRVTESLDASVNGLDDQAVSALKQSQFEPGTRDGKPVAVRITVRTTFSLQ